MAQLSGVSQAAAIPQALADLLGVQPEVVANERLNRESRADMVLRAGPHKFVVEFKASSDRGAVSLAAAQARKEAAGRRGRWIAAVAVPYMGEAGAQACLDAGVSWFDLSGNADLRAPGLHVRVEGRPNRFLRRGRPGNALAPKGSRVARWLLMHPERAFLQREISKGAGVDEGLTSRVVRWLEVRELVVRDARGAWRAKDPAALLDAWHEAYDFNRHRIVRGILGARSSDEVMQNLAKALDRRRVGYAMTGLAGAWLLTQHAMFRTVTVLLREEAQPSLLGDLGVIDEPRGANVWLVTPNDDAVFMGSRLEHGLSCAHPLQVYLDLKVHPERAAEAAAEVRRRFLTWKAPA
jgi:hypothetical protein